MRRAILATLIIAAIWAATVAVFLLFVIGPPRESVWISLIVGLWLIALVVYAALLNPEGQFSRYVIVAAITLAAASLVVGGPLVAMFGGGRAVPA